MPLPPLAALQGRKLAQGRLICVCGQVGLEGREEAVGRLQQLQGREVWA